MSEKTDLFAINLLALFRICHISIIDFRKIPSKNTLIFLIPRTFANFFFLFFRHRLDVNHFL